jgi:luciferase family oxidoreductase group 1
MTTPRIGILDQSPIISGTAPAQAIAQTLELAQVADRLGYHRYWLAEHHSIAALGDPCPEILAVRVASVTESIRVGTGGVLLPYYSPLKVAEVFRMLEAMFPGRIDLGLGRAPGGDQRTALAMSPDGAGHLLAAEHFPRQVVDLVAFLDDAMAPDHPFAGIKAQPAGAGAPEVWLLGSSDYSGTLAAYLGLRFAFAHFISAAGGEHVTRAYREDFRPSKRESAPAALLAVFAICAETDEQAERLAGSIDLRRIRTEQGIDLPQPTQAEAAAYRYSEREEARRRQNRDRIFVGRPDAVRERLLALQQRFGAEELMVISITGDYASRLRSYELLAAAFGLPRR